MRPEGSQAELPPIFEPVEHTLDDVSGSVYLRIIIELELAVLAWRDASIGLGILEPITQVVCIITPFCNDSAVLRDIWLKALTRLSNIGVISSSDVQMNRLASPVTNQMQLAVQPAFGFANGASCAVFFLTPLAAIRCVLIWLASIINVDKSASSRASVLKMCSKTPTSDQRL